MNELDNVGYVFQYPMTCHLLYICAYKGLVDRVVYLLRNSAETQTFLYKEEIEDTIQVCSLVLVNPTCTNLSHHLGIC